MASSSDINASTAPIEKYPYPTEFNVLDFVPKLLSGRNYHKWRGLMRDFIERRGLIGLIDGTAEEEIANQDYDKARNRSDNLVQAWILATVAEDIRLLLTKFKTAEDLWTILERMCIPESVVHADKETCNWVHYLPLHKAVIKGDLDDEAMSIIKEDPDAIVKAPITEIYETALMVAVQSAGRNDFASKLLEKMKPEDVLQIDHNGDNALHWAAYYGNIKGAKMLVNKNSTLPNVLDNDGDAPLHSAAVCGFRDMVLYLMEVTSEDVVLTDKVGVQLLRALISGELYDIALTLLERKPELARSNNTPLDIIGEKRSSFRSGYSLNFWQILIYSGVPIKTESIANSHNGGGRGDIESPANCCISVWQRSHFMFWKVAEKLVPHIRCIREKKLRHHHALELVKVLCKEVPKLNPVEVRRIFSSVLQKATRMGIHEIVEEIILSFPMANFFPNQNGRFALQDAILWRRERVFNLIYQMDQGVQPRFISRQDKSLNNGLHLAALLGPEQQINLKASAAGAVLQMQRELQWFKEVEKFTAPGDKEKRNANGMTPAELFSDTHQNLVKDGEQWMKDTATSCTIVAALIATMVFTAAITVPGGNNPDNGHPVLSKQKAFIIFGISDALALFASITSALMFLLILTSRYAEEDFLHILPKRLIIGLVTLFVSILFTMVAFGAILYLVFGDNKAWILIPVTALASIPITLFGALQFPLLIEMFQSTYGRGIFGKQNDRVLQ